MLQGTSFKEKLEVFVFDGKRSKKLYGIVKRKLILERNVPRTVANEHPLKCFCVFFSFFTFFNRTFCFLRNVKKPSKWRDLESRSTHLFALIFFLSLTAAECLRLNLSVKNVGRSFLSYIALYIKKEFVGNVIFILLGVSAVAFVLTHFYDSQIQGA